MRARDAHKVRRGRDPQPEHRKGVAQQFNRSRARPARQAAASPCARLPRRPRPPTSSPRRWPRLGSRRAQRVRGSRGRQRGRNRKPAALWHSRREWPVDENQIRGSECGNHISRVVGDDAAREGQCFGEGDRVLRRRRRAL